MTSRDDQHLAVAAYVLGALDDAEATRFEEHLADCDRCAAELDSLMGVEPLLAEFAAAAPPGQSAEVLLAGPGPEMLDRLIGEVHAARRGTRRRRLYLVAAAVALIIAGPLITSAVTSGNGTTPVAAPTATVTASPSVAPVAATVSATDPATGARADVAMRDEAWGTDIGLTLSGVQGPLECDLVAVSTNGYHQTVATWSVPGVGYGEPTHPAPLTIQGTTGIPRGQIDHFEVRTLQGHKLVNVNVA